MRPHWGQITALLVGLLLWGRGGAPLTAADARQIADRIIVRAGGTEQQLAEIEDFLEELDTIKTEEGTRILVELLNYYLGEHNHEVLLDLITTQGN